MHDQRVNVLGYGPEVKVGRQRRGLVGSSDDEILTDETFTFKVFKANGGKVIEFRSYDRKQEETFNRLHVIGEDEDFAAELGKIVMYELLRS